MINKFLLFWNKFKGVGSSWLDLAHLNNVFNQFIKYGKDIAISIYMQIIADTI